MCKLKCVHTQHTYTGSSKCSLLFDTIAFCNSSMWLLVVWCWWSDLCWASCFLKCGGKSGTYERRECQHGPYTSSGLYTYIVEWKWCVSTSIYIHCQLSITRKLRSLKYMFIHAFMRCRWCIDIVIWTGRWLCPQSLDNSIIKIHAVHSPNNLCTNFLVTQQNILLGKQHTPDSIVPFFHSKPHQ